MSEEQVMLKLRLIALDQIWLALRSQSGDLRQNSTSDTYCFRHYTKGLCQRPAGLQSLELYLDIQDLPIRNEKPQVRVRGNIARLFPPPIHVNPYEPPSAVRLMQWIW